MPINFAIKLAATIAIEATQMALQASQKIKGPRLDELNVTVADYGTPLPRFLGARKFSCPVFHAEKLKEVKKEAKSKGGKQETYSYYATFAAAIADNEIDKILKIWFDNKLVYDATGVGPMTPLPFVVDLVAKGGGSVQNEVSAYMRVYKGTEDQLPDPRYTSYCEGKFGANSAPAYRGLSYLFFEELPVNDYGNRIPQIDVLASSATGPVWLYETRDTDQSQNANFLFSTDWMAYQSGGNFEWWDVATRTRIGASPGAGVFAQMSTPCLGPDGTAYFMGDVLVGVSAVPTFFSIAPMGVAATTPAATSHTLFGVSRYLAGQVYTTFPSAAGYMVGSAEAANVDSARDFCVDANGDVWGLFHPVGASADFTLTNLTSGGSHTFTGTSRSGPTTAYVCWSYDQFIVSTDGQFYLIDDTSFTVTSGGVAGLSSGISESYAEQLPGLSMVWQGFSQYSLKDGSLVRAVPSTNWFSGSTVHNGYDPVNNAIWTRAASGSTVVHVLYIDRVSSSGTTLGAIVSTMCDAANLIDRDTSALTQSVAGYSWTRGDVKSQMDPVLALHDVDARPHDFSLEFLPRGGAPSGTILTQDFAKGQDSRYKVTFAQDTDLPQMLRVNFADTGFDQQTNNVLSPLPTDSVDSLRDDTIDLTTYAATPDEAQQLADRYMRRQWNSRETIENSLTAQSLALEPGDLTTLNLDGIAHNVRLTKQTVAGGQIDCTFVRDETAFAVINTATVGPNMDGRDHETIDIPAPIKGFVIDAPLRSDSDADVRPLLYLAAGPYAALTFPGAVVYEATGSPAAYDHLVDSVSTGAGWGICSTTLANADPNLWDRGNTLTLSLQNGSLTSVAEADIDADPTLNMAYVGQEWINFTTATLNGDGTYTLSGFKRGRRGTEWAVGSHAAGESIVLASFFDVEEMGTDEVGGDKSFKAQSVGRSLDAATAIDLTFTGATLKPYAPARIKWTTDGTDLFGEIIRRTRIGGSWVGGSTIPLSENSEAYEVDVYHSTTLKRTISVTGTNLFTYTAAMMSADGNAVTSAPPVNVYQLSDAVGRGFALAA